MGWLIMGSDVGGFIALPYPSKQSLRLTRQAKAYHARRGEGAGSEINEDRPDGGADVIEVGHGNSEKEG